MTIWYQVKMIRFTISLSLVHREATVSYHVGRNIFNVGLLPQYN